MVRLLCDMNSYTDECAIQEFMLYKFELSHNVARETKNICCGKGERAVDYSTVTK